MQQGGGVFATLTCPGPGWGATGMHNICVSTRLWTESKPEAVLCPNRRVSCCFHILCIAFIKGQVWLSIVDGWHKPLWARTTPG